MKAGCIQKTYSILEKQKEDKCHHSNDGYKDQRVDHSALKFHTWRIRRLHNSIKPGQVHLSWKSGSLITDLRATLKINTMLKNRLKTWTTLFPSSMQLKAQKGLLQSAKGAFWAGYRMTRLKDQLTLLQHAYIYIYIYIYGRMNFTLQLSSSAKCQTKLFSFKIHSSGLMRTDTAYIDVKKRGWNGDSMSRYTWWRFLLLVFCQKDWHSTEVPHANSAPF